MLIGPRTMHETARIDACESKRPHSLLGSFVSFTIHGRYDLQFRSVTQTHWHLIELKSLGT